MARVTIMRGLPGSGKTTWVRNNIIGSKVICSADDFWYDRGVEQGSPSQYLFEAMLLPQAHAACLRRFIVACHNDMVHNIVVDNTNVDLHEVAPYLKIAEVYGHEVHAVRCEVGIQTAVERNIHNVPEAVIQKMSQALTSSVEKWPRYWPSELIVRTTNS